MKHEIDEQWKADNAWRLPKGGEWVTKASRMHANGLPDNIMPMDPNPPGWGTPAKDLIPGDAVSFRMNGEDRLATVESLVSWHDRVMVGFDGWEDPIRFERNAQFWVMTTKENP